MGSDILAPEVWEDDEDNLVIDYSAGLITQYSMDKGATETEEGTEEIHAILEEAAEEMESYSFRAEFLPDDDLAEKGNPLNPGDFEV